MEQVPQQDKPLSQKDFKTAIEEMGMTYEESTVDVAALSGPIQNPAVLELPAALLKDVEHTAEVAKIWLAYPTITDTFPDHYERRAWRNQMVGQYGKMFNTLYERNKIKGGSIFAITPRFEILGLSLNTLPDERLAELNAIVKSVPDVSDFMHMDAAQRLDVTHRLESALIRFLTFITTAEAV